jgi:hypothetical protein
MTAGLNSGEIRVSVGLVLVSGVSALWLGDKDGGRTSQ